MLSLVNRSADIVSVVSRRLQLEVDGENLIGTCPSCNVEMFIVSPEREIFHCFGCHEGGNASDFETRFLRRPWFVQEQLNILAAIKRRTFRLVT